MRICTKMGAALTLNVSTTGRCAQHVVSSMPAGLTAAGGRVCRTAAAIAVSEQGFEPESQPQPAQDPATSAPAWQVTRSQFMQHLLPLLLAAQDQSFRMGIHASVRS